MYLNGYSAKNPTTSARLASEAKSAIYIYTHCTRGYIFICSIHCLKKLLGFPCNCVQVEHNKSDHQLTASVLQIILLHLSRGWHFEHTHSSDNETQGGLYLKSPAIGPIISNQNHMLLRSNNL